MANAVTVVGLLEANKHRQLQLGCFVPAGRERLGHVAHVIAMSIDPPKAFLVF